MRLVHPAGPLGWSNRPVQIPTFLGDRLHQYVQRGSPVYHVDLAVYREREDWDRRGPLEIAVGRRGWRQAHWLPGDPRGFVELVKDRCSGESGAQFARVVRLLKWWKQNHFSPRGNAAPVGSGIVVAALSWLHPTVEQGEWCDALAALRLVDSMIAAFGSAQGPKGEVGERLVGTMPVQPYDDVFRKMTNPQMSEFKSKLEELRGILDYAWTHDDTDAMVDAFGPQFPE